jgi:type III pantothenate kinase
MLLLIDIGNTNTTIGFYYDNEIRDLLRIKTVIGGRDTEEYIYVLKGFINNHHLHKPEGTVISSVVPEVTPLIIHALKNGFDVEPINLTCKVKTGLKFLIKNVDELGADRIANAVAAHNLYKGDIIVIDFGTATTFCVITEKGEYTGGAIMPGIYMSARALAEKTAKLPVIGLKAPDRILGRNTEENILTGVIRGHAGAVERIIRDITTETGRDYTVLATGGCAELITAHINKVNYNNPLLTLEGLKLVYEMNTEG